MPVDALVWPSADDYLRAVGHSAEFDVPELRHSWLAVDAQARPRSFSWNGSVGFVVMSPAGERVVVCFTSSEVCDRCSRHGDLVNASLRWYGKGIRVEKRWFPIAVHDRKGFDRNTPPWQAPLPAETTQPVARPLITTWPEEKTGPPLDPPLPVRPEPHPWLVPAISVMFVVALLGLAVVWLA